MIMTEQDIVKLTEGAECIYTIQDDISGMTHMLIWYSNETRWIMTIGDNR